MKVTINSKTVEVHEGASLSEALRAANLVGKGVATAVNGEVVPAGDRESYILNPEDNILLIKAFYGG